MSWKLYLDDLRIPKSDGWMIARSFEAAVALVQEKGFPYYVSFDHDLGDNVPTGKDFANWLIEHDLDHGTMPEDFQFNVHSANPVGAANIGSILNCYLGLRVAK